ncbi:GNAT family N-acetyltransferase [Muriicola soli]|uniref:GNAT family N-acetyltransferase n=2 Tax=Muriicola soli TaxID=2507538 RepID=A0A411EDF0_9FLAO|nr:GNAT family N-acetyltransferase [Muriicola soli]
MSVNYGVAFSDKDLQDILELQEQNLPANLSEEAMRRDGFLTVKHNFELLKKMNDVCPHIVASNGDRVIGYALCMHPDFKSEIPVLFSMFKEIEAQSGIDSFMVMGQICVDKEYRGKGVFRGLYLKMKEETSSYCDLIITEVDGRNTRSLKAHLAVGFRVIKKYQSDGRDWYLIVL